MPVGSTRLQLDTHTESVNAYNPNLDNISNQLGVDLSPSIESKFVNISMLYHGA